MRAALLILIVGLAAAPVFADPPATTPAPKATSDEQQLLDLEQRWLDAGIADDRKTLDDILRDDFVDVTWYGQVRGKSVVMAAQSATGKTTPMKTHQTLSDLQVRVRGYVGVVTGKNTVEADDHSFSLKVHFTDVFLKENGKWRAFSAQETIERDPQIPVVGSISKPPAAQTP
ncbi:MAG TPA: nuclear transport factor 2 family protein [Gammaproteobacteria bacterium]|nr:nuclear transport factor 2 family protein [Gammaproteobacteria bacterium]